MVPIMAMGKFKPPISIQIKQYSLVHRARK